MRPPEDEALLRDHDIVWDVVSGDLVGVIEALEELLPDAATND